jgi:chromosome segregation ATPase
MGAESEYRSELFALDKASLIERIAKAEAEARQLREQLEEANASKVVNLYRQPEIDALRSQLERLQSGFDALCTAHADLGQQAAKLETQIERAYMPVSDEEWKPLFKSGKDELGWWCDYGSKHSKHLRSQIDAIITTRKQERG